MAHFQSLYSWPEWGKLGANEYISAIFIAIYVLIVIGLMWSFLASFYFSASTVIYFLLRRDVDGTDLEDVYIQEEEGDVAAGAPQASISGTPPSTVECGSGGSAAVDEPRDGASQPPASDQEPSPGSPTGC